LSREGDDLVNRVQRTERPVSLKDKANVIGGWLPSVTFFAQAPIVRRHGDEDNENRFGIRAAGRLLQPHADVGARGLDPHRPAKYHEY